jgi:plastocyanin
VHARRWAAVGVAVLGVALLAAGCGGSSGGSGGSSGTAASATTAAASGGGGGSDKVSLTAKGIAWSQTQLNLPAGKQVTVTVDNQDSVEHNFTLKEASVDKDVEGGESGEVTFTAPAAGSYQFFCKYHPSQMKGTVTVA